MHVAVGTSRRRLSRLHRALALALREGAERRGGGRSRRRHAVSRSRRQTARVDVSRVAERALVRPLAAHGGHRLYAGLCLRPPARASTTGARLRRRLHHSPVRRRAVAAARQRIRLHPLSRLAGARPARIRHEHGVRHPPTRLRAHAVRGVRVPPRRARGAGLACATADRVSARSAAGIARNEVDRRAEVTADAGSRPRRVRSARQPRARRRRSGRDRCRARCRGSSPRARQRRRRSR